MYTIYIYMRYIYIYIIIIIYIYIYMYIYIYIYIYAQRIRAYGTYACSYRIRPVRLLRVRVSKGLTQADS